MSRPALKLTYFNMAARAELPRLIFHFGGVAFEDERIGFPAFATIKPTLPLGQLPVLEVAGTVFSQSMAIARYAAKVAGLFPEDPVQALGADMISETLLELQNSAGDIVFAVKDESVKAEKTKAYLEEKLPKGFAALESKVQGKYFLGAKTTYADVHLFVVIGFVQESFASADLSAFPKLLAVAEQVNANPGVAAYLASLNH